MDTGSAVNEAAEQGFKLLDKVTEFRFFLALLSVAVALDVALAWTVDRNILTMDWGTLSAGSASRLALAAVAYVFWMAALSPLARHGVEFVFSLLGETPLGHMLERTVEPEKVKAERRYYWGQVRVSEAKERALRDRDNFWMARVEKEEAKRAEDQTEMAALAKLSFGVTGLLLTDWCSANSLTGELSIWLSGIDDRVGDIAKLGIIACVLMVAFPWLYLLRNPPTYGGWMDHPELAKERLAAIEAQRESMYAYAWGRPMNGLRPFRPVDENIQRLAPSLRQPSAARREAAADAA